MYWFEVNNYKFKDNELSLSKINKTKGFLQYQNYSN